MTLSTTQSTQTFLGNGSTTAFNFSFVMGSSANAVVYYTNASGTQVTLTPSQYTLFLNPPTGNQTVGVGGTVTYPTAGSPIAPGTSLTISRIVPLTQTTSISNQGDFGPTVIEAALDTLCEQIQQVSARGGQFRGVWVTGTNYNYGDIIEDGSNGANTSNFYLCVSGNISGVWATDLAAGYWTLAINVQAIVAAGGGLPLTGGTITGNLTVTGTITGNLTGNVTGNVSGSAGSVTTNANLTGPITSVGNATSITDLAIAYRSLASGSAPRGFVNKFRNPVMDVWSRGLGLTLTAGSPAYTADGWICSCTGVNIGITQQSEGVGVANSLRVFGAVGCTNFNIKQRIESYLSSQLMYQGYSGSNQPANATIQFRIQNTTGSTISPTLTVKHANSIDNFSSLTTDVNAVSLGSVAQGGISTLAYTFTPVSSGTANGLEVTLDFGNGLNVSERVWITMADIRTTPALPVGICTNPPIPENRDITTEQDLCARYLPAWQFDTPSVITGLVGQVLTSTTARIPFAFRVRARAAPTGMGGFTTTDFSMSTAAGVSQALTGTSFLNATKENATIAGTVASGLVAGNASLVQVTAGVVTGLVYFTGAEL